MLLAPAVEEPHEPRSPAKTSDFESPGGETRRKNAADRSTPVARHMPLLEGNATAQFLLADNEQASLLPGYQASRRASTLPSLLTRAVTQRSLECAIGWFGGPIW